MEICTKDELIKRIEVFGHSCRTSNKDIEIPTMMLLEITRIYNEVERLRINITQGDELARNLTHKVTAWFEDECRPGID